MTTHASMRAAPVGIVAPGGRRDARRVESSFVTSRSTARVYEGFKRRYAGRVETSSSATDVDVVSASSSSFTSVAEPPPIPLYVPSPMDATQATQQFVVLGVVAVMTAYWWFVLVPSARERLARNKRTGALREYLEELARDTASGERRAEKWFYAQWLSKIDPETRYLLREDDDNEPTTSAGVKLEDTEGGGRFRREPTLEEIVAAARKTPKFWSLDNPVLVGAALTIGLAAVFSGGVAP